MAQLRDIPITATDLLEYLNGYSDFSFELKVLQHLRLRGINCQHGGLYDDPVTQKARQFDIRATGTFDRYTLRLAVECKNLRANHPLLVSCVPRLLEESFHEVALLNTPEPSHIPRPLQSRATILSIREPHSYYRRHGLVGKSTAQVGRTNQGTIDDSDREFYDKWGQCLASAADLVNHMYWDGADDDFASHLSATLPLVVVPNDRLWIVEFDANGKRVADPTVADQVSCYVNKSFGLGANAQSIALSHVEIVTEQGLVALINDLLLPPARIASFFPNEGVAEALNRANQ